MYTYNYVLLVLSVAVAEQTRQHRDLIPEVVYTSVCVSLQGLVRLL